LNRKIIYRVNIFSMPFLIKRAFFIFRVLVGKKMKDFFLNLGRILALDLGEKRIGVAISDPTKTIAQPLKTIPFKTIKGLISDLIELLNEHTIEKIIVGFPLTLKGTYSAKTKETEKVFNELNGALSTPMELFDERLTTAMAHETLRQLDKKPSKERNRVDQLAAMHMLQIYLDRAANLMISREK